MKKAEKKKIFFIYPPSDINVTNEVDDKIFRLYKLPPFDMMMLSTIAKNYGFDTKFCSYCEKNKTFYDFMRDLEAYNPEYIVLKIKNEDELSVLEKAKDLLCDCIVIAAGEIFEKNPFSILQKYPQIDIALRGEIEKSFDEILQQCPLNEIDGIVYKTKNKISLTKNRFLENNLNFLPFMDVDLINLNDYLTFDTKKPKIAIEISRQGQDKSHTRFKDADYVFEEIKNYVLKYNIRNFVFVCDCINFDIKWFQRLFEKIINNNLKISFQTNINLNNLDISTLNILKKAGCNIVTFKIKDEEKNNIAELKKQVKLIKKMKIKTSADYCINIFQENKKTINKKYKLAKKLNTRFAFFEIEDAKEKFKNSNIRFLNMDKISNPIQKNLNIQNIEEYAKKVNRNYYLRLKIFFKTLTEINSVKKIKSFYKTYRKMIKI